MRILMLTRAFNALSQRLWLELVADGHELSIEFDINDATTREAVALWRPEIVVAPFLTRAIPQDVWRAVRCLVVHPGPVGDRGPSALDWAIREGRKRWGVTVLEAVAEMDAGPVWAHRSFPMRAATKSNLYRREVTEAAIAALREALDRIAAGRGPALAANAGAESAKPAMRQADRAIDWARDPTARVLAQIRAADGQPGLRDTLSGHPVWLHDAHPAPGRSGPPGALIGQAGEAVLRATADGAVWIGAIRVALPGSDRSVKLPATRALGLLGLPLSAGIDADGAPNAVTTEDCDGVAVIRFPFLNGAMSVTRARALEAAIRAAAAGPARAILLAGGPEFWSNGIDLATIEAADSPAEASLATIEAMDDVCLAILETSGKWTVAAMQGNAGAGGVFMALAADEVLAREGVVLNPHYRNMGNLYGSEYWTYLLPRRLGPAGAEALMRGRMPVSAAAAAQTGLIDAVLPGEPGAFLEAAIRRTAATAAAPDFTERLAAKAARRKADEAEKPLAAYRAEELQRMRLNFSGFDTSYHVARYDFITRMPHSRTPLHLALHRAPARATLRSCAPQM